MFIIVELLLLLLILANAYSLYCTVVRLSFNDDIISNNISIPYMVELLMIDRLYSDNAWQQ